MAPRHLTAPHGTTHSTIPRIRTLRILLLTLNLYTIYTLLFITIHIIIHYILILKQTLYTINLHINYTLDKYSIHFTYTLFIYTFDKYTIHFTYKLCLDCKVYVLLSI